MTITPSVSHIEVPNFPTFLLGNNYEVSDDLGRALIERNQAVEVVPEKKDDDESNSPAPSNKKGK